jgi:hypothetical protein
MAYRGRCACGAVTAEIKGEPLQMRQCWCRQCQQLAGGNASTNAIFLAADVAIAGDLATHDYIAASGNVLTKSFCAGCGTQVMAQSSARPHLRTLRFGFIEQPHGLRPQMAIWLDEAPDWAVIDPALEHFPRQAPPPPA